MRIQMTSMTIGEIRSQIDRTELTVNHDYQRSGEIWPPSAKSYFIDTILAGYPFQKIYIYAHYGEDVEAEGPIKKEIVDGQQRVETMLEFLSNKFYISTPKSKFHRKRYKDLPQEVKQRYINTTVEIDMILQAAQIDVLEMFRRINSYMAPLKPAERRHADWNGSFKWFVNALCDDHTPVLRRYGVLTAKQIVRMGDAEFLAEFAQVLDAGIVDKNAKALDKLYEKYDKRFPFEITFGEKIDEVFAALTSSLKPLAHTSLMKTYNLYSLFCAMIGRKYGFPGSKEIGISKRGTFFKSTKKAVETLKSLALAIEDDDDDGHFADYIAASREETTRVATRVPRAVLLAKYLDA